MQRPKFDGPGGLIAIGVVLGTMLGASLLATFMDDPAAWANKGYRGDWLGFAGGIVGGLMTLIAAIVAWLSIERQIGITRELALLPQRRAISVANNFAQIALKQARSVDGVLESTFFNAHQPLSEVAFSLGVARFSMPNDQNIEDVVAILRDMPSNLLGVTRDCMASYTVFLERLSIAPALLDGEIVEMDVPEESVVALDIAKNMLIASATRLLNLTQDIHSAASR